MKLALRNYKALLLADLVKKATKNIVRECDEIKEGCFQAYVDESKDTFDTTLVFNSKGEIIENNCDCKAGVAFCSHKAALLLHLINGQKTVLKQKISKNDNTLEKLIHDISPEKLKSWVLDLLSKNKDLSIAFTHEFSGQLEPYTAEELKKLSLDAVKAVVNNRKIVEIAEVKRIIELWKALHESVIDNYALQMNNESVS
jgi:ethanolamine utilization microcompartment shell protein EutS